MNVLLPELLVQALAQRPQRKLARRERARRHVPPQAARRTREDERASLPLRVEPVLLERLDRGAGERERAMHVHIHRSAQVIGRDGEERAPLRERDVVHRDAELGRTARGPRVRQDGRECRGRVLVAVRFGDEPGGLVAGTVSPISDDWKKHGLPRRR